VPSGRAIAAACGSVLAFSGLALDGNKLRVGQDEAAHLFSCVSFSNVGQCSFAHIRRDGIRVGTDLFGHGLIFTSEHDGFAVASNRSHLHLIVLQALGQTLTLNQSAASLLLVGTSVMLSQQSSISETLTKGVRLVRPDESVMLFNGSVIMQANRAFLRLFSRDRGAYDGLLRDGLEELIQSCGAVIDDERFSKIVVDLSGGKDSRMVFGGMLHHPQWHERCRLYTNANPKSDDLPIACGISGLFGAEFDDGAPVASNPLSADDNITFWRSYFHGQYHRMAVGAWTHHGKNLGTINLSGGNGELLRGFWSHNCRDVIKKAGTSFENLCQRIAGFQANAALVGHEEPAAAAIHAELASIPAESWVDKLDLHYAMFRNRSHFGMRGFHFLTTGLTWFPLMAPSLVAAAWSLPSEERMGSKLVMDVIEGLHPVLRRLPFDKDSTLATSGLNCDTARWQESEERRAALKAQVPPKSAKMRWREWSPFLLETTEAHIPKVDGALAVFGIARKQYAENPNDRAPWEAASKLLAMHDAVTP
jgi:hypothetical protein